MAGFSALGTIMRMSSAGGSLGSTSTAAGIADLTNISGPSMSAEQIDVSSHGSTDYFREFVAGFLDAGDISLEGNLTVDGGATDLVDAFNGRSTHHFHVLFPATGTSTGLATPQSGAYLRWLFYGQVTGVETGAPYDDKASFSATVKISGAPRLTASSSS
jgi:predicted secreted protein